LTEITVATALFLVEGPRVDVLYLGAKEARPYDATHMEK
jgi:hypothetical protein